MTKLDKKYLNNIEYYTIENRNVPITLQKTPFLKEVANRVYNSNINLTEVESKTDYFYFILNILFKNSIKYDGKIYFLDDMIFFKLLEDYLFYIFEIKDILRKDYKRDLILSFLEKNNIKMGIKDLLRVKPHKVPINMLDTMELNKYTKLMLKF